MNANRISKISRTQKWVMPLALALGSMIYTPRASAQSAQDCLGALPICTDTVIVGNPYPYSGNGNTSNEIANGGGCYCTESNGVWYKFSISTSGILRFELNPSNNNTDYDWILFEMSGGVACSTLATTTGVTSAMAKSNTWGAFGFNGPTGVSTPNGGTGNCNGPGTGNGPQWCADLNVTAGEDYMLYISNWSNSNTGFLLDFSESTAEIFDNENPQFEEIVSSVECDPFDTLVIEFDEKILCSSVQASDFVLTGPSGTHTITSVTGLSCATTASGSTQWKLEFTPAVTAIGNYELQLVSGSGFVEDMCGNLDTLDSLEFYYAGTVDVVLSGTHNICNGYCEADVNSQTIGGYTPFTYAWNNGLPANTSQSNLCAGTYVLSVTDSLNCVAVDTFEVQEPDPFVLTFDTVFNVSCPGTSNCDGGATVSASGSNPPYTYAWSNGETGALADALCAGWNTVTVTDVEACFDTLSLEILVPDSIETFGFGDTLICITNPAAIATTSTGGTPPFTYVWTSDSLAGTVVSNEPIDVVNPHVTTAYFVSSTDSRGCPGDTADVLVKVRPPLGVVFDETDTICPYDNIDLIAHGTGGDSTYAYTWGTGAFGPEQEVSPDVPAWFTVVVADACGTPPYEDSVFVQVGGYTPILSEIRVEDDSLCPGESIYIIASGRGGFKGPDEYRFEWNFTVDTNRVQFLTPTKTREYKVTITDLCLSEPAVDSLMVYVGVPHYPELSFEPQEACAETEVNILLDSVHAGYRYDIDLGDGNKILNANEKNLSHHFEQTGCFDVRVDIVTDFGCVGQRHFPCAVSILQKPNASFEHWPPQPTTIEPFVAFTSTSDSAVWQQWLIDGYVVDQSEAFRYEFDERGEPYEVALVVESEDGCLDTVSAEMLFERETVIYMPKSFTPNGDGLNDIFMVSGEAIDFDHFELSIHDRWGRQVFRSNNPQRGWDGTSMDGLRVPIGIYSVTLRFIDRTGTPVLVNQQVVVSKSGERIGLK